MRKLGTFVWLACMLLFIAEMKAQIGPPPAVPSPKAQQLPLSGRSQNGTVLPLQGPATGANGAASVNTINSSIQVEGAYQGSVPAGAVSAQPLSLTIEEAIKRGIEYNLGVIGAGEAVRVARAQRLAALAELLPDLNGSVLESIQQINLQALGLRITLPIPGFHFPTVVGPFNYLDARTNFSESLSVAGFRNWHSSRENARSMELSAKDSRELVALAVSASYLQLLASAARIQTANAQIETAQTLYQQAVDRNRSGLNAHIDVSRTLVELQTQQQRLTSLTNDFEKQKIMLARLIGLPMAQAFRLADTATYRPSPTLNLDTLIQDSLSERADIKAAASQLKAAELARKAAEAEYLPSLNVAADYGAIGINPSQSHGTFSVTGAVRFPIYRSGRIRADIDQADAVLAQRRAEYEDTKARAEQDVRNAVLDLTAASQQVRVAESNQALAADTLKQARDRFGAGVADTVELVQAQESVATAEQDYISALYAFNLGRISLARATGQTELEISRVLQGK